MDAKNNPYSKKKYNPLLNVSVTGATLEEFTQNAILCPVSEQHMPQIDLISKDVTTNLQESNLPVVSNSQVLKAPSQQLDNTFCTPIYTYHSNVNNYIQSSPLNPNNQQSYSTETFFSVPEQGNNNLFHKNTNDTTLTTDALPPINQENNERIGVASINTSTSSVGLDLFSQPSLLHVNQSSCNPPQTNANIPPQLPPPSSGTGSFNSYRRQAQKKLSYAPIPGLCATPFPSTALLTLNSDPPKLSYPENNNFVIYDPLQECTDQNKSTEFYNPTHSFKSVPLNNQASFPSLTNTFLIPSTDINESAIANTTLPKYSAAAMTSSAEVPASTAESQNSNVFKATLRNMTMVSSDTVPADSSVKLVSALYRPVYHHWFHKREIEGRVLWQPFSMVDSLALEAAFVSTDISPEHMVATDGGRYDVNILRRQRTAVYWESKSTEVRRCSWFYKGNTDGRLTPFEENVSTKLEEEYKTAVESNQWRRSVVLPGGETVVFHAADVMVMFLSSQTATDNWTNVPTVARPFVVKRGMDEFNIDEGESNRIDHLLFLVHGIGSVCDLKFRSVEEVVDDFRSISLQLVQSHYKSSCEQGIVSRIEVLPVSWHNQLHSEDTGIDRKLKSITLESIPRLRDFTNDTLLDILFYTSPIYCQTIISTVGTELNRIYELFQQRNPGFRGSVSLGGHSLGSLILFDILCHQCPIEKDDENPITGQHGDVVPPMKRTEKPHPMARRMSRRISYMMGTVGTGQPQLTYPHLNFQPIAFFALGSPIGMFVTVRGLESLGEQFALPTCPAFFNIFHPYDPVAYRVESLINSELGNVRPVLIPHHKGRKRMHLELKETMTRVGTDLKQRLLGSMRSTWNSVYQLTMFNRPDNKSVEADVDKALEEQLANEETDQELPDSFTEEDENTNIPCGILNNGRRVDYVLQEAPFEFFNEYIFALTSHVCYWESEDTMLLILKEIYNSMNISTDSQIPQQTMKIERPSPSTSSGATRVVPPALDPLRNIVSNQVSSTVADVVRKT